MLEACKERTRTRVRRRCGWRTEALELNLFLITYHAECFLKFFLGCLKIRFSKCVQCPFVTEYFRRPILSPDSEACCCFSYTVCHFSNKYIYIIIIIFLFILWSHHPSPARTSGCDTNHPFELSLR